MNDSEAEELLSYNLLVLEILNGLSTTFSDCRYLAAWIANSLVW